MSAGPEAKRRRRRRGEVVYFVQMGATGPIKIGTAVDMALRLSNLQVGNPEVLILIGTMSGGPIEERRLHDRFARHRIRGEWFRPATELIDFAATLRPGMPPRGLDLNDPRIQHLIANTGLAFVGKERV